MYVASKLLLLRVLRPRQDLPAVIRFAPPDSVSLRQIRLRSFWRIATGKPLVVLAGQSEKLAASPPSFLHSLCVPDRI